jgi:hypothetical protein
LITITYYCREGNEACELAERNLSIIREEIPFEIVRVDIDSEPSLTSVFDNAIPLLKAGPYTHYRAILVLNASGSHWVLPEIVWSIWRR